MQHYSKLCSILYFKYSVLYFFFAVYFIIQETFNIPKALPHSDGESKESDGSDDCHMVKDEQEVQIVRVIRPGEEVIVIDSSSQSMTSSDDELPDLVPADDNGPLAMPSPQSDENGPVGMPSPQSDDAMEPYSGSSTESACDSVFDPPSPLYQNQEESPEVQDVIYQNKRLCM